MVQRYEQKRRLQWYKRGAAYDTSITFMILFCKVIRKVSFLYLIIYQTLTSYFNRKDDTLRLFSRKNFFSYAYKLDGKSKKYLI